MFLVKGLGFGVYGSELGVQGEYTKLLCFRTQGVGCVKLVFCWAGVLSRVVPLGFLLNPLGYAATPKP